MKELFSNNQYLEKGTSLTLHIANAKRLDILDRIFFKGALRRGFKHYALGGSYKRHAGELHLGKIAKVMRGYFAELTLPSQRFIRHVICPLFVGGITGRAGTTWIQDLLREYAPSHHVIPEIGVFMLGQFRNAPYELYQFINFNQGRKRYLKHFREFTIQKFYQVKDNISGIGLSGFSGILPLRGVKMALDHLERQLEEERRLPDIYQAFGQFYCWLFNYHAQVVAGGKPWISKEPPYGRHADDLFMMLPNAKLLVMARDGRDTAASMYRLGWHPSVQIAMERWRHFTSMTLQALTKCPSGRWMVVRYEDAVHHFEETILKIFNFLEIEPPDVDVIRKDTILRPSSEAIGNWKKTLSREDQSFFEKACRELMEQLGYSF